MDQLSVEAEYLGRAVDYRSERIEYAGISQSLYYDFITYSVLVALGDSYG